MPDLFDDIALPDGIEKDLVVANIIEKCAELEILFPSPVYMKNSVTYWSYRNITTWTRLYKTETIEYNPIENYDRMEEWSDENISKSDSIGKTAGYNSNSLVDNTGVDSNVNSNGRHSGRTHGNIGVTTTQDMIKAEREIVQFNIYDFIAASFKNQFCLLIY